MNIISTLMHTQKEPVTKNGRKTTPIQWEMTCLEEVCGVCSMVINGMSRQASSTLVDEIEHPIRLQPIRTFLVIRDLIIDREKMFDTLKKYVKWLMSFQNVLLVVYAKKLVQMTMTTVIDF